MGLAKNDDFPKLSPLLSEESARSRVQLGARDPGHQSWEAKTLGCKDGGLGAPQGQEEGSGISAPDSLLVGDTRLARTQSSTSARSLLGSHRTPPTPPHPTRPQGPGEEVGRAWQRLGIGVF